MAAARRAFDRDNGSKNNLLNLDTDDLSKIEEEEYMIAADLTLYSNPLNRALGRVSDYSPPGRRKTSKARKEHAEERETIAADLTKYDTPMAELDHLHAAKQQQQITQQGKQNQLIQQHKQQKQLQQQKRQQQEQQIQLQQQKQQQQQEQQKQHLQQQEQELPERPKQPKQHRPKTRKYTC